MILDPAEIRQLVRLATRRTGVPAIDEDLNQEAALRALAALRRTRHIENPRAFLMKIVLDTVRDHWRRRRSFELIDFIDERFIAQPSDFETVIDERRRRSQLREALTALDPRKRATVVLFYEEGLTISEIACRQSKSPSAVKMELLRARRELAKIIRSLANKKSR
jgi:RNA polymerase sigma-70 factor (ECF subfamily)